MCNPTCSESGQLLTINPCGWYLAIKSDRDRLAGVVAGMEGQNARNLEALRRAEAENATLRALITSVIAEYDACDGWNSEGRAAELINVTLREAMKEATNG